MDLRRAGLKLEMKLWRIEGKNDGVAVLHLSWMNEMEFGAFE